MRSLIVTSMGVATIALSCPWLVPNEVPKGQRLFAWRDARWAEVATQSAEGLGTVFRDGQWGAVPPKGAPGPCGKAPTMTIARASGTGDVIVVAPCDVAAEKFQHPVRFDAVNARISSAGFVYAYDPANLAMFRSVLVRPGTSTEAVASRAPAMSLRADVRHFFTLNFDESDIGAEVTDVIDGPVSSWGTLGFSLKILFFRLRFDVRGTAHFFEDAAMIPMLFKSVSDGPRSVHPGTGILFTWEQANGRFDPALVPDAIPGLRAETVLKGYRDLALVGLPRCEGAVCRFTMAGTAAPHWYAMDYIMPRKLVRRGFFPMITTDPVGAREALGWRAREEDGGPNRVGVYFESSGLPKGDHQWMTWLRIIRDKSDLPRTCPWVPVVR